MAEGVFGSNTPAHQCPKCEGVLADWKSAESLFSSLGLSLKGLEGMVAKPYSATGRSTLLPCPSCGHGPMKSLLLKGVELELCDECGACWFDKGELARVRGAEASAGPGRVVGVFEMFWDCAYCEAKALLGRSNRFCPSCGAPQDPSRRYFPPPGKEIAANSSYEGADKLCPACHTPMGAKASHCRNCGSPLEGAKQVARVGESLPQPKAPGARRFPIWAWALVLGLLALITVGPLAIFWKKEISVRVASHSWEREIEIEQLAAVSESAWCDSMPSGAYSISRHREQRGTRQVPDGEECTLRDIDRGDGTFERRQECKPKYRNEPVYADRCEFRIDRWRTLRTERAQGRGLTPEPSWPRVALLRPGNCLGCEREGARKESYSIEFDGTDGRKHRCELPQSRWRAIADGAERKLKIGALTGRLDCDAL